MNGKNEARAAKATGMSAEAFGELLGGMEDVLAFERGRRRGFTVHSGRDLKAIPGEGGADAATVRGGLRARGRDGEGLGAGSAAAGAGGAGAAGADRPGAGDGAEDT